ncbi:MAG: UDP-N-acetylmuramate--L-alanine ligase [Candidatus Bipolaricaulota bacterium]|nr:UDP-N-acetylmuramate--L-alanine ligase [Candidatus Bipolaricaulota bacterium]
MTLFTPGENYHLVGIGGSGMSGLARIMLANRVTISGSDLHENEEVLQLREAGVKINLGHDPDCIDERLDGVIVSSAISEDNVEVQAARARDLPVVRRLHALASLLNGYHSIGVAGTHGKTTTTAMIATILGRLTWDPSYLVGAHCPGLRGNAHLGRGDMFVTEVDESDGLFLALHPTIAVLNNIGRDHLTTYKDLSAIKDSFSQYLHQAERAVLQIDDPHVRALANKTPEVLTVGTCAEAALRATGVVHHHFHTRFDLNFHGERIGPVFLPAPGDHNVRNALCAIGAAFLAGVDLAEAAAALTGFRLPRRRFQLLEENGVTVVDDYAHLPEEIEATLQAIRDGWERRRIVAIFQPHRYTRTRFLNAEFGNAFIGADEIVVTSIYPADERPIPGVSSRMIADAIAGSSGINPHLIRSKEEVLSFLKKLVEPGDFIISFGAGDIWTVTEELSCFLKEGRFCMV